MKWPPVHHGHVGMFKVEETAGRLRETVGPWAEPGLCSHDAQRRSWTCAGTCSNPSQSRGGGARHFQHLEIWSCRASLCPHNAQAWVYPGIISCALHFTYLWGKIRYQIFGYFKLCLNINTKTCLLWGQSIEPQIQNPHFYSWILH